MVLILTLSLLNTMFIKICYDPECALTEQSRKRSANLCIYLQIHCRKQSLSFVHLYICHSLEPSLLLTTLHTHTKTGRKKRTKDYTSNALVTLPIYNCQLEREKECNRTGMKEGFADFYFVHVCQMKKVMSTASLVPISIQKCKRLLTNKNKLNLKKYFQG